MEKIGRNEEKEMNGKIKEMNKQICVDISVTNLRIVGL